MIAFLLANRWVLAVAAFLALLLVVQHERHVSADLRQERDDARAQVQAATAQTSVVTEAGKAADKAAQITVHLNAAAERKADAIESAPGADTELPPAVRALVLDGIAELRGGSAPTPDDPGSR